MSRNKQLHAWAQIDAGGVAVPVVVEAGASKTFVQVVLNDFRTIATS